MPRRHRSGRDRTLAPPARPPGGLAPAWGQIPGVRVHQVTNDREYRCPGCDQLIRPGTAHLVVVPDDDVEGRRHWHSPCWRQEIGRLR